MIYHIYIYTYIYIYIYIGYNQTRTRQGDGMMELPSGKVDSCIRHADESPGLTGNDRQLLIMLTPKNWIVMDSPL